MSFGIGFYEDAGQSTAIIESEGKFRTQLRRSDDEKRGDNRTTAGDLKTFKFWDKFEGSLRCTNIRPSDLIILKTEKDKERPFYFFPDAVNDSSTFFIVRWVNRYNPVYNQQDDRWELTIQLKEE